MQVLTRSQFQLDLRTMTAAQVQRVDLDAIMSLRRFCGQTTKYWSVAQHSMNVARVVRDLGGDANAQAWAILHDAHEAYMGDLIRPLLQFLDESARASIQTLCRTIDEAVADRFRITLNPHTVELVAKADDIVLAAEILAFFATPADRILEIDVVKRHWPLIQYLTLDVMDPKVWGKSVDALWHPQNTVGAA